MKESNLTQTELKKRIHYDPETGIITRLFLTKGPKAVAPQRRGYVMISIKGVTYRGHRLAWLYMTGEFPKNQIDHINHDGTDNRWVNLREAKPYENQRDASLSKRNTSGFTGVRWLEDRQRWKAQVTVQGRSRSLGRFTSLYTVNTTPILCCFPM